MLVAGMSLGVSHQRHARSAFCRACANPGWIVQALILELTASIHTIMLLSAEGRVMLTLSASPHRECFWRPDYEYIVPFR